MMMWVIVCSLALVFTNTVAGQSKLPECEIQELAIMAALGDRTAQYNLGVEFFRGESIPKDFVKAANLWRKASDAGVIGAKNNLGYLIYYGKVGKPEYGEAIQLWRFAAERGFAESQVHLAYAYFDNRFLQVDQIEAYAWATLGKRNAKLSEQVFDLEDVAAAVIENADKLLARLKTLMEPAEVTAADKKAEEYAKLYQPRQGS